MIFSVKYNNFSKYENLIIKNINNYINIYRII